MKSVEGTQSSWSVHFFKYNYLLLKIIVSFLLMGVMFHLLFPSPNGVDIIEVEQELEKEEIAATPLKQVETVGGFNVSKSDEAQSGVDGPVEVELPDEQMVGNREEKCDIFTGDWIPDPLEPIYNNETCHVVEDHQNCMKNGRPDSAYLYWRWRPWGCELPRFNAERFLDSMRNKHWAFVGDSISRNHVQSLVCLLSKVEEGDMVYHDKEYKNKRWVFPTYNFTLSALWSPFLIKADIFEDFAGATSDARQVHIDKLDENWRNQYENFDYMVVASGKWYLKSANYYVNNKVVGCHNCNGENNVTDLGFDKVYRKSIRRVLNYIASSNHKATVLFRTTTPDHFENGTWDNGGTCKRKMPFKEGEINLSYIDALFRDIEFEEFQKASKKGLTNGVTMKLLDTSRMSLLRPDGHPGPYRQFHPFATDKNAKVVNDCLHWCLPGPIDSWNDLLSEMVSNS